MRDGARVAAIILICAFAALTLRFAVRSALEIIEVNDFEVFYYVGVEAGEGHQIYDVLSPGKQRGPFLYPPSAAVLFVPLTWLPHDAAGIVFSALKIAALLLLYWGALRFSGAPPPTLLHYAIGLAVMFAALYRPVDSDVGNGQVNIVVAALAVGGVWLMMAGDPRAWPWRWAGGMLLGVAVAVKLTPALLLVVPLLHRRWSALAAALLFTLLFLVALPALWFGWDHYRALVQDHRRIAQRFTMDWPARDGQATLLEMVQFTRAQIIDDGASFTAPAPAARVDMQGGAAGEPRISGLAGEGLLDPRHRGGALAFWLAGGVIAGVSYLLGRQRLFRGSAPDLTWDLAMLCALIVLLSPRVHKAHLVILIVPLGWTLARITQRATALGWTSVRWHIAGVAALTALFLAAESLPLPVPGFDEPYRPAMFLGVLALIGLLAALASTPAAPRRPLPRRT